jgi:oligopeptide/dipeptide ABC transporter ATP-binding protein
MADRVAVMYLGKIVELAPKDELFLAPLHPYTRTLLSAIPRPDPHRKTARQIPGGDVPSPMNPPSGCRFHTRCAWATDICKVEDPALRNPDVGGITAGHMTACHHIETLPPASEAIGVGATAPNAAKRLALYAERRAKAKAEAG